MHKVMSYLSATTSFRSKTQWCSLKVLESVWFLVALIVAYFVDKRDHQDNENSVVLCVNKLGIV